MTDRTKERYFEDAIENALLTRAGYEQGSQHDYDPALGIDTLQLFTFIGATQNDPWERLVKLYGGDRDEAQKRFTERLARQVDDRGTIDVLRHGVEDRGVRFELAYFRPASGLNPDLQKRYDANRLSVTRQLHYAGDVKALDLVLFCNGLPTATAELKNPMTLQTVDHAIAQYRTDRDPANVLFARRAVVHFAVDPDVVMMTTSLAGKDTTFLPFNRGSAPGELGCGKGNPPNPEGHSTAYLWQEVWERDAWLDILHRFVHIEQERPGAKSRPRRGGTLIFPRYHQWDAVRRLERHARDNGAGHHYLVEHSAGSGKSNTIAWLSHRLASLHDAADTKIFDKVVVITDRRILDQQLQDTIYQLEHQHGVVRKIDESSKQLAEALTGAEAKVVVTTLQKFPFVVDELRELPERRYAIVIDEAHSSQTGEEAAEMRRLLGPRAADLPDDATPDDYIDAVAAELARARGRQPNLSLFAFTATPKARTLEVFGTRAAGDEARYRPFHVYSMRQAIEEGFILDVLRNYSTYQSYWRVANSSSTDPDVEGRRAASAIARYASLHPEHVAQKAEIAVEQVRQHAAAKVGGRAKTMVVCSSRLHAVRWRQAIDGYLHEHGIGDISALVAFSGTVTDPDTGAELTEARMNGFPESQTAERFGKHDENRILVVAEKFQTGFDQPLLHTMLVDRKLAGVHAVQTLSRLNRTHPGKDDTFVLDFVNTSDDILAAYAPFYETTLAGETDPNLLFDARDELNRFGVLRDEEVEAFARVYFDRSLPDPEVHSRIHAQLDPAKHRFADLDDDDQETFRRVLHRFVSLYAFVSQILPLDDTMLEKRYQYCRLLEHALPRPHPGALDLGDLELTHLRLRRTGRHTLDIATGEALPLVAFTGVEPGPTAIPGLEPLSEVIRRINELFGLDLGEADRLHIESVTAEMVDDTDVQQVASANTLENFAVSFDRRMVRAFVDRMDKDEKLTIKLLDDPEFKAAVKAYMLPLVYERARVARQKSCPIGDLLGPGKEDQYLEYKAGLRWDIERGEKSKVVESAVIKTVAAFLNSAHGGTLLIGVRDDGAVAGLEGDYATLRKQGREDRDLFQLHLTQIVANAVGMAAAANVTAEILAVDGDDVCRLHVEPSAHPVRAEVTKVDRKGQFSTREAFFVRMNNATKEIPDPGEIQRYIAQRWGGSAPSR